jgi:Ca2+-binding RTX toxin-like protein
VAAGSGCRPARRASRGNSDEADRRTPTHHDPAPPPATHPHHRRSPHLNGGTGFTVANGGDDNDWLAGGPAADGLYGDGGDDIMCSGDGDDYLDGGDAQDQLHGEAGDDTILGGPGDDSIFGGCGTDGCEYRTGVP